MSDGKSREEYLADEVARLTRRVGSQSESIRMLCDSVKHLDRQREKLLDACKRAREYITDDVVERDLLTTAIAEVEGGAT